MGSFLARDLSIQGSRPGVEFGLTEGSFKLSDVLKRSLDSIDAEIRKEKAETLGRTGERLERILAELADLRKELLSATAAGTGSGGPGPGEDTSPSLCQKVERYARLRAQAHVIRHHLVIQREAVGLRRHEEVIRHYPLPPSLTLSILTRDGERP